MSVKYEKKHNIHYSTINIFDNDIMNNICSYNGFMWHWQHNDYREQIAAREIILSIEQLGIPVFPNYRTCWHFDEKIAQKYLMESIDAPLVPAYLFYEAEGSFRWIKKTDWPIVFKLRRGAGASNVQLIRNENEANKVIARMFGKGYPYASFINDFKERLWVLRRDKN